MTQEQNYYYATGRRKSSVALVRLYMDSGAIVVNGKPLEEAFPWESWRQTVMEPRRASGQRRVLMKVEGQLRERG